MDYYSKYISIRLKRKKAFPSSIEKAIICAIDYCGACDDFVVIVFFENEFYCVSCSLARNTLRYTISNLSCDKHNLSKLYSQDAVDKTTSDKYEYAYYNKNGLIEFDDFYGTEYPELSSYNSDIMETLANLDSFSGNPVFVYGDFVDKKAVLYALQVKFGKITLVKEAEKLNLKSRFSFSDKILNEPVNVSEPAKIINLIGANSLQVFIPAEEVSLKSKFWDKTLWEDIVPKECVLCKIAEIPCHIVNISFEIDGFNNVFCRADDGFGHEYYGILHTPWGGASNELGRQGNDKELSTNLLAQNKPSSNNVISGIDVETKGSASSADMLLMEESNNDSIHISDGIKDEGNSPNTVRIEIPEDAILTYTDIFTERFVRGVEKVLIRDPYIYLPHQFANLRNFIKALNTVICESNSPTRLKSIVVETRCASDVADPRKSTSNAESFKTDAEFFAWTQKRQSESFERLGKTLRRSGIEFKYSYSSFHDRKIMFSNGWTVDLGKGLDIFKKQDDEMQPVRCWECTFVFTFGQEKQTIRRKVRKPHLK